MINHALVNLFKFLIGLIILYSGCIYADEELVNISPTKDVAIHGYDTVAYFTQSDAIQGNENFAYEYKNATWLFSSQSHLDLFIEHPEKYMPQYGGFCAYAASQGARADIDPIAWRVIDGKLYLNYDLRVQKTWAGNLEEHIHAADEYWAKKTQ